MLLELISTQRLTGSQKNKITVVFDGYPNPQGIQGLSDSNDMFNIVFSRKETADQRIKDIVQNYPNPKNIVVVSDDKEIKFFIASCGAKAMGVEDFLGVKEHSRRNRREDDALKLEISYTQMHKINQELKKIWLSK